MQLSQISTIILYELTMQKPHSKLHLNFSSICKIYHLANVSDLSVSELRPHLVKIIRSDYLCYIISTYHIYKKILFSLC